MSTSNTSTDSHTISKYTNRLFVGGLSATTTEANLTAYFGRYGDIKRAIIMKNMSTGASKCFGFVECQKDSTVIAILAEKNHALNGRQIDVNHAFKRTKETAEQWRLALNKRKLFVTGLKPSITKQHLKTYFS